ncbi:CaiB/BaiF CoA transferase family protein [Roseitranquillus sediminis]|uniref:CaiB/BaiF CoA transferase family protein n=1 Tax=Roseitranquillus sediminis TaxID=2809051 RepID=UPI001D0C9E67|nr:CoA transferase [Roseitranquillus sediminis]MBM9593391.1 CoA transferase [Roseitranquillus sediminis]
MDHLGREAAPLPLAGVTVIDLSHIYNGPYATLLLALAGAEVIKVEPKGGEHLRSRGNAGPAAMAYAMLNSNKESMTLDLKSTRGKAILLDLVTRADVVVENFSPGTTDRLGIGPAVLREINPRLIYGSSSGYGKDGPYRSYPAMDLVMQAMTGVISITGHPDQPPVKAGPALCDFSAGVHLYAAIVTALYERERTGHGRVVEVSMQDATYATMTSNLGMLMAMGDAAPSRTGNRHGGLGISPYNSYRASDGFVVLNAPGDADFRAMLRVIGREDLEDDPRFVSRTSRVENMAAVDELLEGWTAGRPRDEIARLMLVAGVPCAPVRELAEVIEDENMHARGSLQRVDHPELGRIVLPHSPLRFEGSPLKPLDPSHPVGADTAAILGRRLGYSEDEVDALRQEGVV